jgi:hypothetical protein
MSLSVIETRLPGVAIPVGSLRNVRHADRLEVDAVAVEYRDPLSQSPILPLLENSRGFDDQMRRHFLPLRLAQGADVSADVETEALIVVPTYSRTAPKLPPI